MKKHLKIMILVLIGVFFTGCSSNNISVDLTGTNQEQTFQYKESDSLSDKFEFENFVIEIPTDGSINTYCVYDDMLYYSLDYSIKYDNSTGENSDINFDRNDNTQIRCYNLKDNTDVLLYQYDEITCIQITDMQCNGSDLVWEDYPIHNTDIWNIKKLDLNDKKNPEDIFSFDMNKGEMNSVTLTITKDNLYWYEQTKDTENAIYLCKYNFKKEIFATEKTDLNLSSPYEHASILNNICATYEVLDDDQSLIHLDFFNKRKNIEIHVKGNVSELICNGKYCIWMQGYDYANRGKMYIYDISNQTYESIVIPNIFSYGIMDNMIIVNQKDGLYCYDIENKLYENLEPNDNISFGYTYQGQQMNIYAKKLEEKFNILNLRFQDK